VYVGAAARMRPSSPRDALPSAIRSTGCSNREHVGKGVRPLFTVYVKRGLTPFW
jgi:hypothetical protein